MQYEHIYKYIHCASCINRPELETYEKEQKRHSSKLKQTKHNNNTHSAQGMSEETYFQLHKTSASDTCPVLHLPRCSLAPHEMCSTWPSLWRKEMPVSCVLTTAVSCTCTTQSAERSPCRVKTLHDQFSKVHRTVRQVHRISVNSARSYIYRALVSHSMVLRAYQALAFLCFLLLM